MSDFQIEKQIAIPLKYKKGREAFFPLGQMEIGDSFLILPNTKTPTGKDARIALTQFASSYSKKTGKKFTTRKVENGLRIWRIE